MRLLSVSIVCTVWALSFEAVDAAQADDVEVAAIRQAGAAYVKALEEGNREAVAAAWTANGDYVDASGRAVRAQELIQEESAVTAGGRRSGLKVAVERVRLLTPEAAIEDGTTEHSGAPGTPPVRSRYTAVWVKREGRWLLDGLRESLVPMPPRNTRLAELEWMLGEFAGHADDGSLVVTSAVFSRDGNFILRELSVTSPEGHVRNLSQRIGWDPISGGFKSWTFDADGAYGEGEWKRQGESWIANTSSVSADGKRSSATNVYSRIEAEGFVLESVGATVEGQSRPDVKVKLLREPPQE